MGNNNRIAAMTARLIQNHSTRSPPGSADPWHYLWCKRFVRSAVKLIYESTHNERYVLTAEAEAIAQDVIDFLLAGLVRHVIEIAFGVGGLVIDRRRNHAALDRHDRCDQFRGPG